MASKIDQLGLDTGPDAKTGGIELTSNKFLQTQNAGQDIKFHLDPAMLLQLQNAPGFTPVIINIAPLEDLHLFLGINDRDSQEKFAEV